MDIVEAWRKSSLGRCTCTHCHYCDRELDVHQHDHYPTPKRAGGTQVVPTCLVCHDLKDRIPLRFWDMDAMHQAFDELLKDKIPELRHLPWPEALAGWTIRFRISSGSGRSYRRWRVSCWPSSARWTRTPGASTVWNGLRSQQRHENLAPDVVQIHASVTTNYRGVPALAPPSAPRSSSSSEAGRPDRHHQEPDPRQPDA